MSIGLQSLQESISTTNNSGRLIFHLFGALAEFERNLIRERTTAGLIAARSRGHRGGRPKALDPTKPKSYYLATVSVDGSQVNYLCPDGSPLTSCTPNQSGTLDDYITSQTPAKIDKILPKLSELASYKECVEGEKDHTKCITLSNEYLDPLTQKRSFTFNNATLNDSGVLFTINDKLYNENRIDKVSHLGDIEEWQVVNKATAPHAFHMHQLDFLVTEVTLPDDPGMTYDNYTIDGQCQKNKDNTYTCPLEPQGYRDTINLPPNSTTTIRIPFLNPFINH